MWKVNLCFIQVMFILSVCTCNGVRQKLSPRLPINLYGQIYFCRWTSSALQLVRMILGQIILVKQVHIHVYSIEVKYLSLIYIVNPLHASVLLADPSRCFLWTLFVIYVKLSCYHAVLYVPSDVCCLLFSE